MRRLSDVLAISGMVLFYQCPAQDGWPAHGDGQVCRGWVTD